MLTLHKADICEADITSFHGGHGRPPVHDPGNRSIRAHVKACPRPFDFIIPQIRPDQEEEAVAADDVGRKTHAFESFGSAPHRPRSNAFWTSRVNKMPRAPREWKIKYESATNQRAYTPDPRQTASVAEDFRVASAREFMEDNMERLEASHAAWMTQCAENPDAAPIYWAMPEAEPLPLAAVVAPVRQAAGRILIAED